jgi:hypothetical protein
MGSGEVGQLEEEDKTHNWGRQYLASTAAHTKGCSLGYTQADPQHLLLGNQA